MPGRIEKTVFISYRRTNCWTALAVFQNLNSNGYDVFFDYKSIPSGDFAQVIDENIKSRAHFIVILSPSALERCNEPGDWLRREIETAIDNKRNIVPLMMEGFDFGSTSAVNVLTGKLALLKQYNGIGIPAEYFDEAMIKLRSEKFLGHPLEFVSHPISEITKQITEEQRSAANEAPPVEADQLTAQEWNERGYKYYKSDNVDEAIRCHAQAIGLDPEFGYSYFCRGFMLEIEGKVSEAISDYDKAIQLEPKIQENAIYYAFRGNANLANDNFDSAIEDFNEAVKIDPNYAYGYLARGQAYLTKNDVKATIADLDENIRLDPNSYSAYNTRGLAHHANQNLGKALADFDKAISLKPDYADAYNNRGNLWVEKRDLDKALADYNEAIQIAPEYVEAYSNRGNVYLETGDREKALIEFNKVINLRDNHDYAYYTRAGIWEEKEDYLKAIADYQRYIELGGGERDGDQREVEEIIKKLKNKLTKKKSAKPSK